MNKQDPDLDKISTIHIHLTKHWYPGCVKNFYVLNNKKTSDPIKSGKKIWTVHKKRKYMSGT